MNTIRRRAYYVSMAVILVFAPFVGRLGADDAEEEIQLTLMRERPVLLRLHTRISKDGDREVRQQFYEVVNEGSAALSAPIVARWTSGTAGFAALREEAEARLERLLTSLRSQIPMTDEQVGRLTLAGKGDVSRYVTNCESIYWERHQRLVSWREIQELSPECQSLKEQFEGGLHRPGSLFYKLLSTMLSPSELQQVQWLFGDVPQIAPIRVHGGVI